jgi:hypothetical protein
MAAASRGKGMRYKGGGDVLSAWVRYGMKLIPMESQHFRYILQRRFWGWMGWYRGVQYMLSDIYVVRKMSESLVVFFIVTVVPVMAIPLVVIHPLEIVRQSRHCDPRHRSLSCLSTLPVNVVDDTPH